MSHPPVERHGELRRERRVEIRSERGHEHVAEEAKAVDGELPDDECAQHGQFTPEVVQPAQEQTGKEKEVAGAEKIREQRMRQTLHPQARVAADERVVEMLQPRILLARMKRGDGRGEGEIGRVHRERIKAEAHAPAQVAGIFPAPDDQHRRRDEQAEMQQRQRGEETKRRDQSRQHGREECAECDLVRQHGPGLKSFHRAACSAVVGGSSTRARGDRDAAARC